MNEAELFADALEVADPAERVALLARVCGNDATLRERVEKLLLLHEANTQFMEPTIDRAREDRRELSLVIHRPVLPVSNRLPPPVLGNFHVERTIGQGGMGIVLKARDKKLQRDVAIKVLAPQWASDADAVQRFVREAQTAAAVRHENVVTIYSVDEAHGVPFLVMELIHGESLHDRMKRGPLPADEVVRLGIQIASGLDAAHRRGVIHRDVKPANILLETSSGSPSTTRVKITDFGLARAASHSSITHSGLIAGTPQYMSPEQANGQPLDHRSDLFSLGSLLYSLCTARPPFQAETPIVTLRRVIDHEPDPISAVNPTIPAWLCEIIRKLMAKRPEDRIQSADEAARLLADGTAAVTASLDQTLVAESRVGHEGRAPELTRERANRGLRSLPRKLALVGVFSIGLATVIAISWLSRFPRGAKVVTDENPRSTTTEPALSTQTEQPGDPTPSDQGNNPPVFADWKWTAPHKLNLLVSSGVRCINPSLSSDELTLVFAAQQPGGDGVVDLWETSRESIDSPWNSPKRIGPQMSKLSATSGPYLGADGLALIFDSPHSHPAALGKNDLWLSTRRTKEDVWAAPQPLGPSVNSAHDEWTGSLSSDGLTLYFASDRPGGRGEFDLWMAQRPAVDRPFDAPQPVRGAVNSSHRECQPKISADGLELWFVSDRPGSSSRYDLWMSTRADVNGDWRVPVNLGDEINRREHEISGMSLSADGQTIIFSRPTDGRHEIWATHRIPPADDANQLAPSHPIAALTPEQSLNSSEYVWSPVDDVRGLQRRVALGPHIAADELSLWFHAPDDLGRFVLWESWRRSTNEPFGKPLPLDESLNDLPGVNLSDVTLSADGLSLAFCRSETKSGAGADIWMSSRPARDASWSRPVSVGRGVNSERGEWEPELSPDGLELYFHSDRENAHGGSDLFVSRRPSRNEAFGAARNLGDDVNSHHSEGGAALSSDGRVLLFHRVMPTGTSYWQSTRPSATAGFGRATPLKIPGLAARYGSSLTLAGSAERLYFQISRDGSGINLGTSRRVPRR